MARLGLMAVSRGRLGLILMEVSRGESGLNRGGGLETKEEEAEANEEEEVDKGSENPDEDDALDCTEAAGL